MNAPEDLDGRSDLYTLGAVAFYLLTGRHLFEGKTVMDVVGQHLHADPPRASEHTPGAIPPALDELIYKCVAKTPDGRPASALAFLEALEQVSDETPWTAAAALAWWERGGPGIARAQGEAGVGPGGDIETKSQTLSVKLPE